MEILAVGKFVVEEETIPVVDVRAPAEFARGHIPGAHNIPILDDQERALVGTLYKQAGRQEAVKKGLELVGPKMAALAQKAEALTSDGKLRVYCWRGGMRSEKMAWLFETAGMSCQVLKGGYKAYRQEVIRYFNHLDHLLILLGTTGCGKTEILHQLAAMGEQVIDLEALAGHRGSAFGGIGMEAQPTTMQFQNDLYHAFLALEPGKRIWLEGESRNIGQVFLPETMWASMQRAVTIEVQLPQKERASFLVQTYGTLDPGQLAASIRRIGRRLGGLSTRRCLNALRAGDLHTVAVELLAYYDKAYAHSQRKAYREPMAVVSADHHDPEAIARALLRALTKLPVNQQ